MTQNFSSHNKKIRLFATKQSLIHRNSVYSTCMASNLPSRKLAAVGNKFVSHVIASRSSASLLLRRTVHVSVYDKNLDDHVRPALVPDEAIEVQSEKYWSPHPKTGVFGPEADHQATGAEESGLTASEESVLEQKTFFRPQEDLDKPAHP